MFLSSFTYKQRKIFLSLAKEILTVDDGIIDGDEEASLRSLCAEMSLSYTDGEPVERSSLKTYFPTGEEKRILILELVALGYSNRDYHEGQNEFTDEVSAVLGVPIEDLRNIEGLLNQYNEIQTKFIQFIEG